MQNIHTIAQKIRRGALALGLLGASLVSAQTSTTTPGVPTTGLGGMLLTNAGMIILSIILVAIGLALLIKSKKYGL